MEVDRLQWEMAEWEIHTLRNMYTVVLVKTRLFAMEHPEAQGLMDLFLTESHNLEEERLKAFQDPEIRHARIPKEGV